MSESTPLFNPFVGLRAFEESEDYLFFGRSKQINELLKKLNSSPFLAVIGSSGSGKSSLVKSGELPAIYSGFMAVGKNWHVAIFRPGNDPIGNLTKELSKEGTLYTNTSKSDIPYESIIESSLRRSSNGLVQVYKDAHLPPTDNLLIVVDQFEELFRFSKYENEGKNDSLHFIQLLLTATQNFTNEENKEYHIYVMITMRSDFLGDCAQFRGLPEAINDGQYLVPRMTREEIREAITGPVAVSNATISQRLVTRLLNDINNNPDQLPVLQHAMMRTWDAWYKKGNPLQPIDFEDYEKIGEMKAALSLHAEEAYKELTTDKQRKTCELMFKALTDKSADVRGIRRPKSVEDLCILTNASSEEIIEIVNIFRKPGRTFLMPPAEVDLDIESVIDISHESLMRVWERLVRWTIEEAQSGEVYLRLSGAAARAAQIEKEKGEKSVLTGPELKITLDWFKSNNPTAKWAEGYKGNFELAINFLKESEQAELAEVELEKQRVASLKREKIIRNALIIAGLIGFLIFLLIIIYNSQQSNIAIAKQLEISDRLKRAAIKSDEQAQKDRAAALLAKSAADKNAIAAHISDSTSKVRALEALEADSTSKVRAKEAIAAAELARAAQKESLLKSKSIALNEYLRLIRTGPTDKFKIRANDFDYKVVAYAEYINLLDTPFHPNSWNNELYEKLYFSLIANNGESEAFSAKSEKYNANLDLSDNVAVVSVGYQLETKNTLSDSVINTKVVSSMNKIKAIHVNKKDRLVICATLDNMITVLSYDANYKLTIKNKIPMGALVTALDYDPAKNVIFFGLLSGEIGYILYGNDKKNQPVYDNLSDISQCDKKTFVQEISAVDYFSHSDTTYLLATSINGKAVVYKLDQNQFKPNEKLSGIELPINKGGITAARYDELQKGIILKINDKAYLWNPFVFEVQEKLKKQLDATKYNTVKTNCKFY